MKYSFESPKSLVIRARKHIDELTYKFERHYSGSALTHFENRPNRDTIEYGLKFNKELDPQFACIAFDAVNCLRSSLDHAVFCAAQNILDTEEPESTKFPFGKDADGVKGDILRKGKGIPEDIKDVLMKLEPYKDGKGHALWCLNIIRNSKVHRIVDKMANMTAGGVITPSPGGGGARSFRPVEQWNDDRSELIYAITVGEFGKFNMRTFVGMAFTNPAFSEKLTASQFLRNSAKVIDSIIMGIEAETARILHESPS